MQTENYEENAVQGNSFSAIHHISLYNQLVIKTKIALNKLNQY